MESLWKAASSAPVTEKTWLGGRSESRMVWAPCGPLQLVRVLEVQEQETWKKERDGWIYLVYGLRMF